ncbi:MAG: fumarylacetoacetate hydrolase family protein [Fimbriimonas sp.]|nr:fumarylacetoacetate hydrolase family protein [Fimbriimonas sp.]
MKIVAVGRNYAEHARELGNEIPEDPVLFMKPASALVTGNGPFVYPNFTSDVHFEVEIVLRMCKLASQIPVGSASDYYDAFTVGIDFTARDVQSKLKAKGLPWEIAKSFDGSAPVGEWIPVPANQPIEFSLSQNGAIRQKGTTADMIHGFDDLIHHMSRYFTLEPGDLVFTGTPAGVGPVSRGDVLEAYIGNQKLLSCKVE